MSEVAKMLKMLEGTKECEILIQMDDAYRHIFKQQEEWYKKSQFFCPEGCGECCRNFEPDLMKGEVIYMAAWLLENQPEVAEKICNEDFPFNNNKGCPFWDENKAYHCTIYGARPFICRLFGASAVTSKYGDVIWKPCKFYPAEKLAQYKVPLQHRQYNAAEVKEIFGKIPPVMTDVMEESISIISDFSETKVIRKILPEVIRKLKWIYSMNME